MSPTPAVTRFLATVSEIAERRAPATFPRVQLYGFEEPAALVARESLPAGAVLAGPALVTEMVATTLIHAGWEMRVDRWGNLQLRDVRVQARGKGNS